MARLQTLCKYCNKVQVEESRTPFLNKELVKYSCGHAYTQDKVEIPPQQSIDYTSVNGECEARNYQKIGVNKMIGTNLNMILADQMRLGKTPTSLIAVRHALREGKIKRVLCIVRSANMFQWVYEIRRWVDAKPLSVFPILSKHKHLIPPCFDFYVISMDSLRVEGMLEAILGLGIDCIIADEAHSFKNTDSSRSQALVDLLTNGEIKHKLFLTGTPIKNRADEFFVMLNLVAPQKFPSMDTFRRRWLMQDEKGRWSRINPYSLEAFKREIEPFYLRREKQDVYTDIPEMNRVFTVISVDDPKVKAAYNKQLQILEERVNELEQQGREISFQELSGNLMILRRICGMAKVPFAIDYMDIFLDENESTKLTIGIHHKDVRNWLRMSLSAKTRTLELSGSDSAESKYRIMKDFERPENQFLIMNMAAGGVGMDFHYCHNVLALERMWSSADEEQFEYRFYNPDRSIAGNAVTTIEYPIAAGTVDEHFYDLVERKRQIFGETLSANWSVTNDNGSFKELVEKTIGSRL